jgi:hypothetical protein
LAVCASLAPRHLAIEGCTDLAECQVPLNNNEFRVVFEFEAADIICMEDHGYYVMWSDMVG